MKHVVKQSGQVESYSLAKHRQSIIKSLHAVRIAGAQADTVTDAILAATDAWLKNKHEVSFADIRAFTTKQLEKHDKHAAIVYKNHKDMW